MTNNTRPVSRGGRMACAILLAGCLMESPVPGAEPVRGEAIVVNKVGTAGVYLSDGPVHEGRQKRFEVYENSSVGETARLVTGHDGQLCVVLSPGAALCVAPDSELTFLQLRLASDGLPQREEDLVRRIYINLLKGRILIHAGAPVPSLDIRISMDAGEIRAGGGTFSVSQQADGTWAVFNEAFDQQLIPANGTAVALADKGSAVMARLPGGGAEVRRDGALNDSPLRAFEVCDVFFQDLEQFFDDPLRFDRQGLSQYVGGRGSSITFIGGDMTVADVSPSFRPVPVANVQPQLSPEGAAGRGGRWERRRIWDWYNRIGPVKGFNYVPRYAVNSTETWQVDTFDEDVISEELGWAHDAGYTSVRVQLQYVVWKSDPDGFMERFRRFLELAHRHGLKVTPVLFDDLNVADIEPVTGPQPEPVPGVHNARWTPGPGAKDVQDRSSWPSLEKYVRDLIGEFKRDERILFWDLYNRVGDGGLGENSLPLMSQTFNWARDVNPSQPLAVATWGRFGSAIGARIHERSDLVTFQSFDSVETVEPLLMLLERFDRPVVCTAWLMRQRDNTFEKMLPLFAARRIGWFNRGLVNGKTQTWIQQPQFRSEKDPDLWQHDVFRADGKPYRADEVEMIKAFRFQESSR